MQYSDQVLLPLSPTISSGFGILDMRGGHESLSRECYDSIFSFNNFTLYSPPAAVNNNNNSGSSPEICKPSSKGRYIRQEPAASSSLSAQTACNSASDDAEEHEQQHVMIDERKRRRMASNRESARRSRMRKQKHLDELRAQLSLMRGENRQILASCEALAQRYSRALDDNRVLKSQTMELFQQLRQLQQTMAAAASQSGAGAPFLLNALAASQHLNNNNILNIDVAVDSTSNNLSHCSDILLC